MLPFNLNLLPLFPAPRPSMAELVDGVSGLTEVAEIVGDVVLHPGGIAGRRARPCVALGNGRRSSPKGMDHEVGSWEGGTAVMVVARGGCVVCRAK